MASISAASNLKINGGAYYNGTGPVVLTWSGTDFSGEFMSGAVSIEIAGFDNAGWGEAGMPSANMGAKSFTLSEDTIAMIAQNGGTASITVHGWGVDSDGAFIAGEASNAVTFRYVEAPPTVTVTACGAPTSVTLASDVSRGEDVTLSWRGAKDGEGGNEISGYEVEFSESDDGKNWGGWQFYDQNLLQTSYGSMLVSPADTVGHYRRFRVRTLGWEGEGYHSGWTISENTLRRDTIQLEGFTDPTLIAGTTPIKALHMQELQDRTATLRTFYGLSAYTFTPIVAGQTSLAGWTAHVNEIRTALDEVYTVAKKTHAAWLTIPENRPRVDVMQQLRDVVLSA